MNFYLWDYIREDYVESKEQSFTEWCKKQNRIMEGDKGEYAELIEKWQDSDFKNESKKVKNESKYVFVLDGILKPDEWAKQRVKLLFVLKEAYDSSEKQKVGLNAWDEMEWISKKTGIINGKNTTWRRIYQWTKAILEGKNYSELPKPNWDDGTLDKIAVINIKKFNGESRSENQNLIDHAERHSKELLRQIELINPDVIVCGYTCWLLDIVLGKENREIIRKTKSDLLKYKTRSLFKDNKKEVIVIDFWHPACIKEENSLYENLVESYKSSIREEDECSEEENTVKF
ncbi:MAG: hypothetical protein PUK83_00380 [Clostridia bacterium]|nr:hypothetical protein [Clostridia bacterium]MDY5263898.1 hypothetical protein [Eubacteriales bacterium]